MRHAAPNPHRAPMAAPMYSQPRREPGKWFHDLPPLVTICEAIVTTDAGTISASRAMVIAHESAQGEYETVTTSGVGTSQEGEALTLLLCVTQLSSQQGTYWVVLDSGGPPDVPGGRKVWRRDTPPTRANFGGRAPIPEAADKEFVNVHKLSTKQPDDVDADQRWMWVDPIKKAVWRNKTTTDALVRYNYCKVHPWEVAFNVVVTPSHWITSIDLWVDVATTGGLYLDVAAPVRLSARYGTGTIAS